MIKGVLFDMDGVLADSEHFMSEAAMLMFSELGVKVLPEDFLPFIGMGENRYLGGVAESHGVKIDVAKAKASAYGIYGEIIKGKLKPLPGAHEFVLKCRNKGLKLALATSADRIKMKVNLAEIGLPPETFHAIVTGEDIENKKPFPDIYLKAAREIGLEPDECLVVEDAVSGIKAGKKAGCRCLAVTISSGNPEFKDADWLCQSLLKVPEEALNW